jgi:hypothetical protein
MRYMLLIYSETNTITQSDEQRQKAMEAHWSVIDETKKLGIFRGAEPLEPTSTATTIRMREGKAVTVDGPFAETKEQLAGYYILDCKDLDEAIAWASKIPVACWSGRGCIEVRPIRALPARLEQPENGQYATPGVR